VLARIAEIKCLLVVGDTSYFRVVASGDLRLAFSVDEGVRKFTVWVYIGCVTVFFKHSIAVMGPFVNQYFG